ncbi:hypothetical protein BC629DRAFT_701025 [Irpex lacteus]|nr:hypothetical protein BC629DRAFT_701025 [Irpex lacteus]
MICTPMFPLLTSRILSLPISPSMAHPVCVTQPWHNKQPCVSTAQHRTSRISSFYDGSARLSILCYSKGLTHGQRSPRYPLARGGAQVPGLLRLLRVLLVDNPNVLLAFRRTRAQTFGEPSNRLY